ncbi:hypothetical protein BST96_00105 [Oceanicoccus sagamiensis]|uniref:DUF2846 domain-containing protein n=2 Tax=Oceanicoccus sagamiensis TaxID=716816 RepID=A0A1X9N653_9GAMM|nr:hypothetical protein BST96_00105 [Oceanicoccus sagamiensis]
MKFVKLFFLVGIMVLGGCAASGPVFVKPESVPAEKSLVYFYREMGFVASAVCFTIFIDGREIGCLKVGGYLRAEVDPGESIIVASYKDGDERVQPLSLQKNFQQGEVYYYEYVSTLYSVGDMDGGVSRNEYTIPVMPFSNGLIPRTESEALQEVSKLKESI